MTEKQELTPEEVAERRRIHAQKCRESRDRMRVLRAKGGVVKPKRVVRRGEPIRNWRTIQKRIEIVRAAKTEHAAKHGTDKLPKSVLDSLGLDRRAS